MFDVITVGARCAGAATALLLARKGYKVLVVDRARFRSEIPRGHFIQREGPPLLQRWGVLSDIVKSGCPPVTKVTTDFGDFPLTGTNLMRDGIALGYGPRRRVLDALLIEAAILAGAEFRDRFLVDDYLLDGQAILGIRGRSYRSGVAISESARITIGADGKHSSVARAVSAGAYYEASAQTCWYFSYWSGVPVDGLEMYYRDRNALFVFPTNEGLTTIFVAWPISEFGHVRQNIEARFIKALGLVPQLEARVRCGRREERFYGTADLPNFFRKPYGSGWALVGDAGHHKDPFLALGICDALRDAELLASAIDGGLSGSQLLSDSLAGYEQQRNAASMQLYQENLRLAQFKPIPEDILAIRAAVRGDQEATNRFYMARQGMIPPEEFFNPENLQRLKAAALVGTL